MDQTTETSLCSTVIKRHQTAENCAIIWLDPAFSDQNEIYIHGLEQLGNFVGQIQTFGEPNDCADFIANVQDSKLLFIVSNSLGQQIVPLLHDMPQIHSIYIFCTNDKIDAPWIKDYSKIRNFYKDLSSISEAVKQDIQSVERNLTPISICLARSRVIDLNTLDPTFMYCQVLKEIFLDMDHGTEAKQKLVELCQSEYARNVVGLRVIDEFRRDYEKHTPAWWYTRDCFVYRMLNKALRTHHIEIINKFGFFIKDLHRQLQHLQENVGSQSFTVYRGQGMLNEEFEHLKKSIGGLISFNNFLSTSIDENISRGFALPLLDNPEVKALLFVIIVDPTMSPTPMASLKGLSFIDEEKEILFGMSTVFRINQVNQEESGLWRVHLTLTSDSDPQLSQLTAHLREEARGTLGLDRLGQLMTAMSEWDKAEELYLELLHSVNKEDKEGLAHIHHMLGYIASGQKQFNLALKHYEKSVVNMLDPKILDNARLTKTYLNIGIIHQNLGDFDQALEYFQRSLQILSKQTNPNQQDIATLHNNMGGVFQGRGQLDEALESFEMALTIFLKCLPPTHSHLSTIYNNIGFIYATKKNYTKTLFYYEQCLFIQERSLPPSHPSLTHTHRMLTAALYYLKRYNDALKHAKQALEISRASLSPNHPQTIDDEKFCDFLKTLVS